MLKFKLEKFMQIEGKNAIRQALNGETTITKIFIDKNFLTRKDEVISLAKEKKIKIEFLPKAILDKKSKTDHHQGYIAETVEFKYSSVEAIIKKAKENEQLPFIVILDGIEDPHNLGAIIRTCECAGVHGIIIPNDRACQINETVVRTSTGAISEMAIAKVVNIKRAIEELKENDIWVFGAEIGGNNIYKQNLNIPLAIVIGSEGKGIHKTVLSSCDGVITLPLMGKVNSLNASVACGIVIFETLRQRLS